MAAFAAPITAQEQNVSESTVILQIEFGLPKDSRKVSSSQFEVDTDKQLLRAAKKIMVSPEFEPIRQVDRKVHEFEAERWAPVDRFLDSYPLGENMSERLRVLHNPMDYPPIDVVRTGFYFTWLHVAYGVLGKLRTISGRIWQDERENDPTVRRGADRSPDSAAAIDVGTHELHAGPAGSIPNSKAMVFGEG